jgi:hypothetical protein
MGPRPTPDKGTFGTGGFESLAMESVPERCPMAAGVKVTCIRQLPPGAIVVTQLLNSAKSPVTDTELTVRGWLPALVRVMYCGTEVVFMSWSAKLTAEGEVVPPCDGIPLPLRAIGAGVVPALVLIKIVNAPLRGPSTVGLKVVCREHVVPARTPAPQLFNREKSPVTLRPFRR